ncbi:DUF223 domain-containing protein [Raphanus sativus]|nr:DUF223 domain-containing protein [Raphanus sativus]
MSASRKIVLVKDLKPYKEEWRVRLKLLHSWKTKTTYGGESLELIFADETGQKIHASCKRNLMYRVQRDLQIGEWKEVENFKISAEGGQYRPSKFQYKITIIGDTVIRRTDYRNENNFLSLSSYEDIGNGKCEAFFLIDVMGQLVDLGEVRMCQLTTGENRKRVQFRLRDTNGNELACCLWGSYADQIESHMEESTDETVICLIRFAKINNFRGEVQITNAFDTSLLMLNPSIEEAIEFRQKLTESDALPLALLAKSDENKLMAPVVDDWNEVDIKSISEICLAVELLNFGMGHMLRLKTQILFLFKSKIWLENLFSFGISIKSDNVTSGSDTFKVSEVWSGDHIQRIESLSEPVSLIETISDTLSTGEVCLIDHNKESSSDVSTLFSKRKDGDAELNDKNSTSKKLCVKKMKMEK